MSNFRTLVGISLDTSASMRGIASSAARDYNQLIYGIKDNAIQHNQDVIVSVVKCGSGNTDQVSREIVNSSVTVLQPIPERSYEANGRGTPLYDSVGELIDIFESSPYISDPDASFLLMIVTDGDENSSRIWSAKKLSDKIKQLQATDRWTFTFRVPKGSARKLIRDLNLYEGNVQEWETSTQGMEQSTTITSQAMNTYFNMRSTGVRSSSSFYTSLKDVSITEVKSHLVDISSQVKVWAVQTPAEGNSIREFVEFKLGNKMKKGAAFYELTKREDKVQDTKLVIIQDKSSGAVYSGSEARDMIGLPKYGNVHVKPGDHGNFRIYIQSTSVNRKLLPGTSVLYWENFN